MMIKNEEKHLRECLEGLKKLRNNVNSELIIVDTGSTDSSLEIAREFTDKIFIHPWNNDFSAMRNITISYAKGDWIFIYDGDEVLTECDKIIDFLNGTEEEKYNSATMVVKNLLYKDNFKDMVDLDSPRFFRNDDYVSYEGAVHNKPNYVLPTYKFSDYLLHYGYISDDKDLMERKFNRTANLLKNELEKDPENIYYWYQLSVSYQMHSDIKLSLEPAVKAYELVNKLDDDKKYMEVYAYMNLISVYLKLNKYEEAENICYEAIKIRDEYVDTHFYLANALYNLQRYDEAVKETNKYLEFVERYNNNDGVDKGFVTYTIREKEKAYIILTESYYKIGNCTKALEYFDYLEKENHVLSCIDTLANIIVSDENRCEVFEKYKKKFEDNKKIAKYLYLSLESIINSRIVEEDKIRVIRNLSHFDNSYGILNKVRTAILTNTVVDDTVMEIIKKNDFNNAPSYYGDIIWYLLKNKIELSEYIKVRENKLSAYIEWISNKYENYSEVVISYMKDNYKENLINIKNEKVLLRTLLILDKISNDDYVVVFDRYLKAGVKYITEVYNRDIVEDELVELMRSDEDEFFVYIYKAVQCKRADSKKYLSYLMKALSAYDLMSKGIGILKDEFENEFNKTDDEMSELKEMLFNNINTLIMNNKVNEASEIIGQYEDMWGTDIKLLFFKSKIKKIKHQKLSDLEN